MYQMTPAAYICTHSYLKTMQHGIQSLHVIGEMVANFEPDTKEYNALREWASEHKVVRILDGGGSPTFENNVNIASKIAQSYGLPFASFIEPDCFGKITAFGFIVTPEVCFDIDRRREALRYLHDVQSNLLVPHMSQIIDPSDNFPIIQFLKTLRSAG
jgi:hypothetical protein